MFSHQLCRCFFFCNHSHAEGVAEGGRCLVVISQPYRSPDGSFDGTVSESGLCVSPLAELSVLTLLQICFIILKKSKSHQNLTLSIMGSILGNSSNKRKIGDAVIQMRGSSV